MNKIHLFKPYIGEEEIQAVSEVLRSGWIGLGPKVEEFENESFWDELIDRLGERDAIREVGMEGYKPPVFGPSNTFRRICLARLAISAD